MTMTIVKTAINHEKPAYHKKMPILLIFFGTKKIHYVKEKNISCYAASQHKDSKKK